MKKAAAGITPRRPLHIRRTRHTHQQTPTRTPMMTKRTTLLLIPAVLAAALLLEGCAVTPPVENASETPSHFADAVYKGRHIPMAENTEGLEEYRVYRRAATGFVSENAVINNAKRAAFRFCDVKKKDVKILSLHRATPPYILGNYPRAELVFTCVPRPDAIPARELMKGAAPAGTVPAKSRPSTKSAGSVHAYDKYAALTELKELRDKGVLSQAEFEAEKKKLLGN